MIKAVILLLALSRAANCLHSSYLSGYPSYSYGSGLYGSLYGSGLTYGSGLGHGYYGSGIGHGYYGSGIGHGYYGSGLHYGGHAAHLTSAIKPSIYSSRHDLQNPSSAVLNRGQIISNAPGKMEFIMGGGGQKAQIGAIAGQSPVIKYAPRVPYSSGAMLSGGSFANEAPAKIEFVLGGTGYRTGAASLEGHAKPAVHKYGPMITHNTGSLRSSGVLANDAPGKIEFTLGDSGYNTGAAAISGQPEPFVLKSSPALRRIGQAPKYGLSMTDRSGAHIAFNQDFSRVSGVSGIGAARQQSINLNKAAGLNSRPAIGGPQRSGLRAAGGFAHSSAHGQSAFSPVQPAINVLTGAAIAPKYTPRVPYSSGAMLGGGLVSNESPAKIEFVLGDSGFKTGAAALHGQNNPAAIQPAGMYGVARGQSAISARKPAIRPLPKVASPITGAALPRIQSRNVAAIHGGAGAAPGHISFNQDLSRVGGQSQAGIKPQILSLDKLSAPVVGTAAHHGSGIDAASLHSAGIGGISAIGGHENILSAHDIAGVSGLHSSGIIPAAPALTAGGAIKPLTGNIRRTNLIRKSGSYGHASGVAAGPHMTFDMGQAALRKPGMNVASLEKVITPAVGISHGSGIDAASLHSAGIGGISAIGGHENILSAHDIAGVSGLHSSGAIPAAPALTAGGAIKPLTGNIRRANWIRKSGAHGLASGVAAGPHMTFDMGQAALRKPGMNVASLDKVIAPAVATSHGSGLDAASLHGAGIGGISAIGGHENILFSQDIAGLSGLHSSGVIPAAPALTAGGAIRPSSHRTNLIHRSGAQSLTSGPQINFNLGEAALRKPGMNVASLEKIIAPAVASRPIYSTGIRGVSANIPAYGSSGIAGPAGISFIQDFSKAIGSQTAGVQPVLSIGDKLSAPIIPRRAASPRNQAALRNTAGILSSSFTKPVSGALAYRAPKLPGSVSSSLAGPISQGGSIIASGPAINIAEGHAMDFKQGVAGQVGGHLANLEIAPESGLAHFERSSILAHSSAGAAIPSGIISGVQHSSTGSRSGSLHGSAESLSGDKTGIFVDGALGDKSTILFHSRGVAGTGSLLGDQGSIIELVPSGMNTALPGQGMVLSRSGVLPPFPNFPSSSHSGFSHVAREHATDKSLFYSAGSPNLVSSVSTGDIIRK